jgi:transglutaminase-like putative cysteine protease
VTSRLYEGIEFLTWLDDRGRVRREEVPALGLSSRIATREEAERVDRIVDIVAETMIETNRVIADPRAVDDALYEVWIEGDDVSALVPVDRRQSIESRTDRGALLRVRRVVPPSGGAGGDSGEPENAGAYLEGNTLLQVSHPEIRAAAHEAVGDAPGGWASAVRIERYVFDTMKETGFGSAFASALEVLQDRRGDCSEHAVLAAALCRAVGIPSRVVTGLVHVGGRFAYHMWIEVWADGGWYALDPTIGAGSVDATHIKLAASALEGGAVGDLSLPIMRAMNKLGVEVVEYSN